MDKKINVLIYPSGSENAIEVKEALSYKVNINVFGASSKKDHSLFIYEKFFYAPNVNEENFLSKFNELLKTNCIDFVIPTHDTVAEVLSKFKSKINATIITSDYYTNHICRHKKLIYDLFKTEFFGLRYYSSFEDIGEFPCFLKPDVGEGGKFSHKIRNRSDLNFYQEYYKDKELIITEYLPGNEYTIDCFTDSSGKLRFVGPRLRNRIFGGISVSAITIENQEINSIAEIINSKLKFRGYWFFQVKEDINGKFKLMEISTRPAGTMALYRQRGINFILLSIYDFLGYSYEITDNKNFIELDRCLKAKYNQNLDYDSIYLDFDDTVIFNNKVNRNCLLLLYQAKERNIPVILITKHNNNVFETLEKFSLSKSLFTKIIQISNDDEKYKFIEYDKPIFIDNAFQERKKIKDELGIPVFDTDAIESLIDWRL